MSFKCRRYLLQSCLLLGIKSMHFSEIDAHYQSISLTSEKPACSQPWGQSGSPPALRRVKDPSMLLDADSHSSFDKGRGFCQADKPNNCSNLLLHSCRFTSCTSLAFRTTLWSIIDLVFCPHCCVPLTHEYCKQIFCFFSQSIYFHMSVLSLLLTNLFPTATSPIPCVSHDQPCGACPWSYLLPPVLPP